MWIASTTFTLARTNAPFHTFLTQLREEQRQRKAKLGIQAACTFDTLDGGGSVSKKKDSTTEEEDEEEAERQRSIGEVRRDAGMLELRGLRV
mgnify:CR=1 FL=1